MPEGLEVDLLEDSGLILCRPASKLAKHVHLHTQEHMPIQYTHANSMNPEEKANLCT